MQKQTIIKIYSTALLITITMLCIFIYLNIHFDGTFWNGMQLSKSALTVEYCELNQTDKFFHQTMNTYSNLTYFFLGMIVIIVSLYDAKNTNKSAKNAIQQFPLISFFFGCCLIYLCFGSAFFHASLTWIGQRVDMNATYSICITLIGISYYRLFSENKILNKNKKAIIAILLITIVVFIELHLLISSLFLLPFLIFIAVVFTILNYNKNKNGFNMQLAILSFLFMFGAFVLRTLDLKKIGCDPISVYQGHALWHLFTGMSAFMLYWFYRSEKASA